MLSQMKTFNHDSKEVVFDKNTVAIVFDTETTGLPPRHSDTERLQDWDNCRIVQLAWQTIYTETDTSGNYIIKPNGFTIPPFVSKIHGITDARARKEGYDIAYVMNEFERLLERYPHATLVAHNLKFDMGLIITEAKRLNLTNLLAHLKTHPKHCTMLTAAKIGNIHWQKLNALYETLFKEKPEGVAHDAMWDVMTCAKIYKRQTLKLL